MTTKINLLFLSLLTISLIFTSCKKEQGCMDPTAFNYNPDAQKNDGSCIPYVYGCTDLTQFNYNPLANSDDSSCIDIINGCLDFLAINYNADANVSDESCLYAYDIAQGIWNIEPNCDDITIPIVNITISLNDQLPESIEVQGDGDNQLFIDIDGTQVSGDIDTEGNITVPEQTVSLDPTGTGVPIPVDIEGDGKIELDNTGQMNLTYNFDFQGFPLSSSCSITLSR